MAGTTNPAGDYYRFHRDYSRFCVELQGRYASILGKKILYVRTKRKRRRSTLLEKTPRKIAKNQNYPDVIFSKK